MTRRYVALLLLPLLLAGTACTADDDPQSAPSGPPPFADCAGLAAVPAAGSATAAASPAVSPTSPGAVPADRAGTAPGLVGDTAG
ncbi:TlpA family protein disulfide reductase, partial [Micromonospora echinofusca]|nr:TlpA family protein disulfide reductase [Micromonospora echinofusca]